MNLNCTRENLTSTQTSVSTRKYNAVTFLPKALLEFRRVANLYFLLTAALSITSLVPVKPVNFDCSIGFYGGNQHAQRGCWRLLLVSAGNLKQNMAWILIFSSYHLTVLISHQLLSVTLFSITLTFKNFYILTLKWNLDRFSCSDYAIINSPQDLNVNTRTVKARTGNGLFVDKLCSGLSVGDVVKVNKDEYFPSDLLLLSSSYEDGVCYVETLNLDRETNLKVKRCLEVTLDLNEDAKFSELKATIRCEDPNRSLYNFVGNLEFDNKMHPLSPSQVLLRDSKLRNTDYVYGVVIFSGHDTKVVGNSTTSPSKRSRLERKTDKVVRIIQIKFWDFI